MPLKKSTRSLVLLSILTLMISSCYRPPYNEFQPYDPLPKDTLTGASIGAVLGLIGSQAGWGALIGGVVGDSISLHKDSKANVIRELNAQQIQYVEYGNTRTLIIPTDKYFIFNTNEITETCYVGLYLMIKLIRMYPRSIIYVAGFTDDIGTMKRKRLMSQARAEAMVTFLWANGIQAQRLNAEGYADKYPISQNAVIHGSAQNRRLEVQWVIPFNNVIRPAKRPALTK